LRPVASCAAAQCKFAITITVDYHTEDENNSIAEALRQYLESPNVTIRRLELHRVEFRRQLDASKIFQGLSQNASIHELALVRCILRDNAWDQTLDEEQQYARQLASLIRSKPALHSLSISLFTDVLQFQEVVDAVVYQLSRRDSQLRSFELTTNFFFEMAHPLFLELMNAVTGSIRLNRVRVEISINQLDHLETVLDAIPLLLTTELDLILTGRSIMRTETQERLLEALKTNYVLQNVQCMARRGAYDREINGFSEPNLARLSFYLDRNRKLARWTENPMLVPRELWQYAIALALRAGRNALFSSLLSLSGEGIGLRQEQSRKPKRSKY